MPDDDLVAELLGALVERLSDGEKIDVEAVVREHPEAAEEIRAHLEMLDLVDRALVADADSPERIPERIGDYRVETILGSGGMGTVYRASAEREGPVVSSAEQVAVKVIHPHLLERRGFFRRFLREAELGKRVVHENVVRTLDVDAVRAGAETSHFLIMEYVEGRTLRVLLDELETVPEGLLREIAKQVSSGLSAIHAAGIVHRDLKPENALITADHRVRIMDLGVARLVEDSTALTQQGQFAGSLLYAAPEQFDASEVGPAADLYALGVLLYELATGENPFRRDGAAAVMAAHRELVPPLACERNPEVSRWLSEVLATLLEKSADRRFDSAEALGRVLDDGEEGDWWRARSRALERTRVRIPTVPVRRETELHGRETEFGILDRAWESARAGKGNVLLLEGEAGIGKSRLVDAFLRGLGDQDAHVLYGSYPPAGGMGGLSDAIRHHFGAGDLEQALAPYLTTTPRLVPAFAALVERSVSAEGSESLSGDALHAVFAHLVRGLAARKPLLWVVEDLHFAGADSRKVVLSMARAVEGHPVLLLLTTRPGLPEDEIAHFSRLENFARSGLGRLSAREVILLLQDAFKSEALADKLGARIALKSDGVPFFVFEMIRGLKEGQFVTELPDGSWVETKVVDSIEVPSAVRDLVEARLQGLSMDDRALLDLGAVLGYEFDPELPARVQGRTLFDTLQRLALLERTSGVVRAEGRRYRFDHHQIQEVIYEDLAEPLREECHTLLADAFATREELAPEVSGEAACFLAHHHVHGRRPEDALPHLTAAVSHLQSQFLNERALELADRALEVPGLLEGRARGEVLLHKSYCLELLGRLPEQEIALREVEIVAEEGGHPNLCAQAAVGLGEVHLQMGGRQEARANGEAGLALARESGDRRSEGRALGVLGNIEHAEGRYEEARRRYEAALALCQETSDRFGQVTAVAGLGLVAKYQGRPEDALEHFERERSVSVELGYRRGEAGAEGNLAGVLDVMGRSREAQEHEERNLELCRTIGARVSEGTAALNLGLLLLRQGLYREAESHVERGLSLARETGNCPGEGFSCLLLSHVGWASGSLEKALAHHAQALEIFGSTGNRVREAEIVGGQAEIHAILGRHDEARALGERALALARETRSPDLKAQVLENVGALCLYGGLGGEATGHLQRALAIRRKTGFRWKEAESLLRLGRLAKTAGRADRARLVLEEALGIAQELEATDLALQAATCRAALPGAQVDTALALLREHEALVGVPERVLVRFDLWQATEDATHLQRAHDLLTHLVEHAPEADRRSMVENVPLHREIARAWEAQGRPP